MATTRCLFFLAIAAAFAVAPCVVADTPDNVSSRLMIHVSSITPYSFVAGRKDD